MAQQRQRRPRPNADVGSTSTSTSAVPSPRRTLAATTSNDLPDPSSYANVRCRRRPDAPRRPSKWLTFVDCLGYFIAVGLLVLICILIWEVVIPTRKQRIYYGVLSLTLIPVVITAYTALRPGKPVHQRVTPVVVVCAILGGQFPVWFNAGVVALALMAFGWVTRPGISIAKKEDYDDFKSKASDDDDDEKKSLLSATDNDNATTRQKENHVGGMSRQAQLNNTKAAMCGVIVFFVFMIENFFIWVVSATYEQSHDPKTAPEPLQDNGQRVMRAMVDYLDLTKREVVSMRRVWNAQYALVAALGVAMATLDFHPTRQLWSFCCRALLTVASARSFRTISFLLTVLPSQNKFCYYQHFPSPPPTEWWPWIMEGIKPQSHGGCNDLIVSGHATITSTVAAVAISMAEDNLFSVAVCWLLALDYAVEIFEGFHYSVDMWMGAIIIGLLWRVWKPIEDNDTGRNTVTLQDVMQRFNREKFTVQDAMYFGGPAFVSFLQVTFIIPSAVANITLAAFVAACVAQMMLQGFQQYTKYLFYCAVYMAFGIYL